MSDQRPVVGEGNPLVHGALHAVAHLAVVQHAAAAVHDQRVVGQVVREFRPRCEGEAELFAGELPDPPRKLHGPDVLALPVVSASLRDQYAVAVSEILRLKRAPRRCLQDPFPPRHQNRERRERNIIRHYFHHGAEGLRIRHDSEGLFGERLQHGGELFRLGDERGGVRVQDVTDGLDLGQDHAAFGRGGVDRRHQDHDIFTSEEVGNDLLLDRRVLGKGGDPLFEFMDVGACPGTD